MSIYEAAKQALDALELGCTDHEGNEIDLVGPAITALRAALAEDVPETNFGNMAQVVDSSKTDHIAGVSNMVATSQESRQVEPVAYVTGYFDGRCVIKTVEPVLLPAGMALYRSLPTCQEFRQVEPVGYFSINSYGNWEQNENNTGEPFYAAPPKREPLTDEWIQSLADEFLDWNLAGIEAFARAIERAHGIGGEE